MVEKASLICIDYSTCSRRCWLVPTLVLLICMLLQYENYQSFMFLTLNHWATQQHGDYFWSCLTMLGDTNVALVMMAAVLLWRPSCFAAALASFPAAGIGSGLLKAMFNSPRPGAILDLNQFHVIGYLFTKYSFPSGHSITIFAIVVSILACLTPERVTLRYRILCVCLLSLASLVAFSRVAVGAHWLIDILAGSSMGWLAGLNGAWLSSRYAMTRLVTRFQLPLFVILALLSTWLLLRPGAVYPDGNFTLWLAAIAAWLALIIKGAVHIFFYYGHRTRTL